MWALVSGENETNVTGNPENLRNSKAVFGALLLSHDDPLLVSRASALMHSSLLFPMPEVRQPSTSLAYAIASQVIVYVVQTLTKSRQIVDGRVEL